MDDIPGAKLDVISEMIPAAFYGIIPERIPGGKLGKIHGEISEEFSRRSPQGIPRNF